MFDVKSEVEDAHGGYANIEVTYLLQVLEEFAGIVIMATNLLIKMDKAFSCHKQYIVIYPSVDVGCCESIGFKRFCTSFCAAWTT